MDVDVAARPDDAVDDRAARQLGPPGLAGRAEHQLAGVLGAGELDERGGDVGAGHLGVPATELAQQPALFLESLRVAAREAVGRAHVDPDQLASGSGGHAGTPPEQPIAVGSARRARPRLAPSSPTAG